MFNYYSNVISEVQLAGGTAVYWTKYLNHFLTTLNSYVNDSLCLKSFYLLHPISTNTNSKLKCSVYRAGLWVFSTRFL